MPPETLLAEDIWLELLDEDAGFEELLPALLTDDDAPALETAELVEDELDDGWDETDEDEPPEGAQAPSVSPWARWASQSPTGTVIVCALFGFPAG